MDDREKTADASKNVKRLLCEIKEVNKMKVLEKCPYITPCGYCCRFSKDCELYKQNRKTKIKVENHDGCAGCDNELNSVDTYPCNQCKQAYLDRYTSAGK